MPESLLFWVSYVALWSIVLFMGFVIAGLARVVATGSWRTHGDRNRLQRGDPVPEFATESLSGSVIASAELHDHTLLFVSPSCSSCLATLDELAAIEPKASALTVVSVSGREDATEIASLYGLMPSRVVADPESAMAGLFAVDRYPTGVVIDGEGRIKQIGQPLREMDQQSPAEEPSYE